MNKKSGMKIWHAFQMRIASLDIKFTISPLVESCLAFDVNCKDFWYTADTIEPLIVTPAYPTNEQAWL